MKKCWKIRNDSDIEQCLHKLNVDKDYIKIILEEDSEPMLYLNQTFTKPDFIYIIYNYDEKYSRWGWIEEKWFNKLRKDYEFCGEINMRKEKLKKLNGKYR